MSDISPQQRILDEYEIRGVREKWAFSRDRAEWDKVQECFHPGATVLISWFSGTAEGFVERSRSMLFAGRRPEERSKHWLGAMRVELNRQRAILETDVQVLARDYFDGHLFDYTSYSRFYDRLEKRDGVWRILDWTCIYDTDQMAPVIANEVPAGYFDAVRLEGQGSGFAFMRFRQAKKGRQVPEGIVLGGSEDEKRLRRAGEAWLASA